MPSLGAREVERQDLLLTPPEPLAPRDPALGQAQLWLRSCSPLLTLLTEEIPLNSGIVRSRKSEFRASSVVKEYI
jgi:hypothetical protein